jgi:hypothetical protein
MVCILHPCNTLSRRNFIHHRVGISSSMSFQRLFRARASLPVNARHIMTRSGVFAACPLPFKSRSFSTFGSSLRDITEIPDYRGPGTVRNGVDFIVQTLNHLDHSRSVWVTTVPKAAIEDDLREFFEESGYPVERIFALYRPQYGSLHRQGFVVFQNAAMASSAVDELHGAALFAGKVTLRMLDSEESTTWLKLFKSRNKRANWVDLTWGWLASKSPRISDLKLREPPTRPIKDGL